MASLPVSYSTEELPDVLTAKQVAAYLQVSEDTVYRLVSRGELPGKKIGGSVRVMKSKLLEYLNR